MADTIPSYPSRVISAHARGYPTKQTRSAQHAMISRTLVLLAMVGEAQHNSYIHTEYTSSFHRLVTSRLSRGSCWNRVTLAMATPSRAQRQDATQPVTAEHGGGIGPKHPETRPSTQPKVPPQRPSLVAAGCKSPCTSDEQPRRHWPAVVVGRPDVCRGSYGVV